MSITTEEAIRLIEECGQEMRRPSLLDREEHIKRIMTECNCDRKCAEWVHDHGAESDASVARDVEMYGE